MDTRQPSEQISGRPEKRLPLIDFFSVTDGWHQDEQPFHDEDGPWGDVAEKFQYVHWGYMGSRESSGLWFEIRRKTGGDPRFLVCVNTTHAWEVVGIRDFPALMEFLRKYGRISAADSLNCISESIQGIESK